MDVEIGYSNNTTGNHVHRAGCRDLKTWATKSANRGIEAMQVTSREALIKDMFGDILSDYPDEPNEWRSYLNSEDLTFYPCVSDLPNEETN